MRVLSRYRISKVVGDRFGGQFPAEQFAKRGVRYEASSKAKSDITLTFCPSSTAAPSCCRAMTYWWLLLGMKSLGDEEMRHTFRRGIGNPTNVDNDDDDMVPDGGVVCAC